MTAQLSQHTKRSARASRRAALRKPIVQLARQLVIAAINTLPADHRLKRWSDPLLRVWELPEDQKGELLAAIDKLQGQVAAVLRDVEPRLQPWQLGELAAVFQTETQVARVGQARKAGRPPKPANSNDQVAALLRAQRPDDFKGRFTLKRAEATRRWLEGHRVFKSTDAVTKLINRAKRPK